MQFGGDTKFALTNVYPSTVYLMKRDVDFQRQLVFDFHAIP